MTALVLPRPRLLVPPRGIALPDLRPMCAVVGRALGFMSISGGLTTTATWNPSDKEANVNLTNGNLTATIPSASASGVRGTISKSAGKWTIEFSGQTSTFVMVGLATGSAALNSLTPVGTSIYYDSGGQKSINGAGFLAYGTAWKNSTSKVLMYVDCDGGTFGFILDGVDQGSLSYSLTNPVYPYAYFPSDAGDTITMNAGASAFTNSVPSGYTAGWGT